MLEIIYNNPNQKNVRRKLRKDSTPQEKILWLHLRNKKLGINFKRQYSVGGYIIDFYCPTKRIGIELDGFQHLGAKEYDNTRTEFFKVLDIKILRFWNNEIDKNIDRVLEKIKMQICA